MTADTWHEEIVGRIVRKYHANTRGWRGAFECELAKVPGYAEDDAGLVPAGVWPDAFRFDWADDDGRKILHATVWEVELSNPLDYPKLRRYAQLLGDLDASELEAYLQLFAVDRWGTETKVDLWPFWAHQLVQGRKARAAPPPVLDSERDWERLKASVQRAQRKVKGERVS